MLSRRTFVALSLRSAALLPAQVFEESYTPNGQRPALLLTPRRLRLLRRERERKSQRWQPFEALLAGNAAMPEPGFALALYYQVAGDESAGRRALEFALSPAADLRQRALVLDWCSPLAAEKQSAQLTASLSQALERPPASSNIAEARSRAFAAIAVAGAKPALAEAELRRLVVTWFRGGVVSAIEHGRDAVPRADLYALLELLHAVRDNLMIDLRESARAYFRQLPVWDLLSYYPASYPEGGSEYRIPASRDGMPDTRLATLARAADLALVSYESNALETQFLQGWLMHDRFILHSPFGVPYEFLWANPYQPGLGYYKAPLAVHDELLGRLFVRESWDDSATWAGYFDGQLQLFENGTSTVVAPQDMRSLHIGGTAIEPVAASAWPSFSQPLDRLYLVGLKPGRTYALEPDHHELAEERADPGGIVSLEFPGGFQGSVRIRER
ncbi:MAG TPA: hypothetical protein VHA11_14465 [Bryobacteraceae bacterium]|nr:hypothetical protein [Bryobacteraceae bacterium]